MASHVALEEAGAVFEAKKVNIFAGEQHKPDYLAINPRAKAPALRFDDGRVLLESAAILGWIGTAYLDGNLLGADLLDRARTIAMCAWLSGAVHPAFGQFVHPERLAADTSTRVDQGAEFVSRDLDLWACQRGAMLDFSRPGKLTDDAFIASLNGMFQAECLNAHWCMSLDDARAKCEAWRSDDNEVRPHSAIGDKPRSRSSIGRGHMAQPDRETLEAVQLASPTMGGSSPFFDAVVPFACAMIWIKSVHTA